MRKFCFYSTKALMSQLFRKSPPQPPPKKLGKSLETNIEASIKWYGEKLDDVRVIEKILWSLSSRFEHLLLLLKNQRILVPLTVDQLMATLKTHEQRTNKKSSRSPIQTFFQRRKGANEEHLKEEEEEEEAIKVVIEAYINCGRGFGNRGRGGRNTSEGR
ncbi:hypothetical protein ACSBR1_038771 [Camellia fascicularis]